MDPVLLLFLLPIYSVVILTTISVILVIIFIAGIAILFAFALIKFRTSNTEKRDKVSIAFFHPYCDAGGGGERVLWCALRALKKRFPAAHYVVYTGDVESAPDQILKRVKSRFQIEFSHSPEFVYLHKRNWVEAKTWPRFTLLGQSVGSLILGHEALSKFRPDIYIDTMGYAFTLPLFKIFGKCKTACYVHYPTVSTDMLNKVKSRKATYNNQSSVTNSRFLSGFKYFYYKIFAAMYGYAGSYSDLTMVNSSWTEGHISYLWGGQTSAKKSDGIGSHPVHKVYPPCDTSEFTNIVRKSDETSEIRILSLGQFRPEKDHALQIRTMFELRQIIESKEWENVKLVLIGGVRNEEDERRVKDLKDLCKHLSVEDNVEFLTNLPFDKLKTEMAKGLIGIHTMWNEHFGIAVVEMLASGLITIAHRSGGPLMDIVIEDATCRNGYLAVHEKEYAAAAAHVIKNTNEECRSKIRERAKDSVKRFSDQQFEKDWIRTTETLISTIQL